jgi:hypothetical protein
MKRIPQTIKHLAVSFVLTLIVFGLLFMATSAIKGTRSVALGKDKSITGLIANKDLVIADLYGHNVLIDTKPINDTKEMLSENSEFLPRGVRLIFKGLSKFWSFTQKAKDNFGSPINPLSEDKTFV